MLIRFWRQEDGEVWELLVDDDHVPRDQERIPQPGDTVEILYPAVKVEPCTSAGEVRKHRLLVLAKPFVWRYGIQGAMQGEPDVEIQVEVIA